MEYVCVHLDPACKLSPLAGSELFYTDDLGLACTLIWERFSEDNSLELAVIQPRTGLIRATCRLPHRDAKGRFV